MAAIAFPRRANMAYHGTRAAGVSTVRSRSPFRATRRADRARHGLEHRLDGQAQAGEAHGATPSPGLRPGSKGIETTDPHAAAIPLPLGGAKGSGLSLLIELLTSLVIGNPLIAEVLERTALGARHRQNGA